MKLVFKSNIVLIWYQSFLSQHSDADAYDVCCSQEPFGLILAKHCYFVSSGQKKMLYVTDNLPTRNIRICFC